MEGPLHWSARRVLSRCSSNTLTAEHCVDALGEVLVRFARPELAAVTLAGTGSGLALLHHPVVVLNRLLFGLLTTLCAMLLGGGLAFSVAPSVPGRVLLERLVVMPLYLTPLLTAMGWSWLASPKSGLVNLLLHAAFGARVTIDVVSAAGGIVVTALAAAPLPFLLLSDALRALDPALLEAARVHGAVPRMVFRITFHCCCRRPWHPLCWCSCTPSAFQRPCRTGNAGPWPPRHTAVPSTLLSGLPAISRVPTRPF
jgi:hypothetical protein